jgi:urocanate hydratase
VYCGPSLEVVAGKELGKVTYVMVCDGTPEADERIYFRGRVLTNDPMMGIFRHADAGYEIAQRCADKMRVKIPMR